MKHIALLILVFLALPLLAQERSNESISYELISSYSKVSKAAWYHLDDGEWKQERNGETVLGPKTDFTETQLYQLKVDSTTYDVMIIKTVESGYKYPTIRQGFFTVEMTHFAVFDSLISKLCAFQLGSIDSVSCEMLFWEFGGIPSWTKDPLAKIAKSIHSFKTHEQRPQLTSGFVAWSWNDSVRFWMPDRGTDLLGHPWKKSQAYYELPRKDFFRLLR